MLDLKKRIDLYINFISLSVKGKSKQYLLGFNKVRNMSVIIYSTDVEPGTGTYTADTGDKANFGFPMGCIDSTDFYPTTDDLQQPVRAADLIMF